MKKIIFVVTFLVFGLNSNLCFAKSYSATQLFKFYNTNKFPKVGKSETQTKAMSFETCKQGVEKTISGFAGAIPSREIVNAGSIYMVKIWTNESEMLFNCSGPDEKMTIVISPFI